eukprot:6705982-Prorocentrum_lima.AAC.1
MPLAKLQAGRLVHFRPNALDPGLHGKLQPKAVMGIYLGYVPRVGCMLTPASFVIALDELK